MSEVSKSRIAYLLNEARKCFEHLDKEKPDDATICHGIYSINTIAAYMGLDLKDYPLLNEGQKENYDCPGYKLSRKIDFSWKNEIAKYLPQIQVMSFAGAKSTIKWLMEHVEIRKEHLELAGKLKDIESSDMSKEEKTHARITSIFPKLKGE